MVTLFLVFTCFVAGFAAVETVCFNALVLEEEAADTTGIVDDWGEEIGGPSQVNIGIEVGIAAPDAEGTKTEAEVFRDEMVAAIEFTVFVDVKKEAFDEDRVEVATDINGTIGGRWEEEIGGPRQENVCTDDGGTAGVLGLLGLSE